MMQMCARCNTLKALVPPTWVPEGKKCLACFKKDHAHVLLVTLPERRLLAGLPGVRTTKKITDDDDDEEDLTVYVTYQEPQLTAYLEGLIKEILARQEYNMEDKRMLTVANRMAQQYPKGISMELEAFVQQMVPFYWLAASSDK
jgi:hypothetical protein